MRMNLPVTKVEYSLHDGQSIVSKTDLKGNITYVNPYFIEISGFDEDESIGAPQNIQRHPDMPAQAFADMWQTIKQGIPWTGLVQNRRKSGEHYWVLANITPVREQGQIIGYMSVRTKPARQDVAAAEKHYADLRKGTTGYAIAQGNVVKTGFMGWLGRLRKIDLSTRITLAMASLLLQLAAASASFYATGSMLTTAICTGAMLIPLYLWRMLQGALIHPLRQALQATYAITGAICRAVSTPSATTIRDACCASCVR